MRRILLVEDEEILRESYQLVMSVEPYELDVAENGKVALELCAKKTYDLILLDLMMPVMDGVEFLKNVPPDVVQKSKVIVLSNLSSGGELEAALKSGAHKNVVKADLSPRQLLSLIRYELVA